MRKNAATKLMALFMALLLAVTMLPVGDLTAQAAAKKPGAVTKIKKIEVNPTTVILTYNKAKNAKGYQVRAYKGKKLVKSLKTRDTACTVKGLSAETKYTIKVRAYNGSKYGKEKSLTLKTETKNLAVTGLKASSVTKESVKVKYNKAKNAKGYQIRVYKGNKRVSEVKTKNTSCTIGKLQEGTEYTVKIKAYKGKKFGKEKSIIVKTARGESDSTEDDSNTDDTPGIVMPGESTSTGDALVAEYNAYVAYEAEQWKKRSSSQDAWSSALAHASAGITYNVQYTDKYNLFKYKAGTEEAICEMYADIFTAAGFPAEKHDVLPDVQRFPEVKRCLEDFKRYDGGLTSTWGVMYVSPFSWFHENDKVVNIISMKGTTGYNLTYLETKEAQSAENWEFVAYCPHCGEEFKATVNGLSVYGDIANIEYVTNINNGLNVTGTYTAQVSGGHKCKECTYKRFEHPGSANYEVVTATICVTVTKTFTKEEMLASHRLVITEPDKINVQYPKLVEEWEEWITPLP